MSNVGETKSYNDNNNVDIKKKFGNIVDNEKNNENYEIMNEIHNKNSLDEKSDLKHQTVKCLFSTNSSPAKTIFITNNYNTAKSDCNQIITTTTTTDNLSNNNNNNSNNNNNITIFAPHDNTSDNIKNGNSTVVLERINICINNHFNDPISSSTILKANNEITKLPIVSNQINTIKITEELSIANPLLSTASKLLSTKICNDNHSNEPDSTSNIIIKNDILSLPTSSSSSSISSYESLSPTDLIPKEELHQKFNTFVTGDDVLVRNKDGRYYLGTIMATGPNQCLIKFDDNTKQWSPYHNLKELNKPKGLIDAQPICVICKNIKDQQFVKVCEKCGRGYHKKCMEGNYDKMTGWCCARCSQQTNRIRECKKLKDVRRLCNGIDNFKDKVTSKHQLPYNIDVLIWDPRHRVNKEQIYCYCGGNGEWYTQMLQCSRCAQWFHEKCIHCLKYPLYCGDRFYIFVCSMCNPRKEFIRRLEMDWTDIVHLLLFNLTTFKYQKYYDVNDVIIPYARDNWDSLQLPENLQNLTLDEISKNINQTLKSEKIRFKCGSEIKKKCGIWGLRQKKPPPAPTIPLPMGPPVTEEYLIEILKKAGHNVKFISKISNCNMKLPIKEDLSYFSSIPKDDDDNLRNIMMGKAYKQNDNNGLCLVTSDNESTTSSNNDILQWEDVINLEENNDIRITSVSSGNSVILTHPEIGKISHTCVPVGKCSSLINSFTSSPTATTASSSTDLSNENSLDSIRSNINNNDIVLPTKENARDFYSISKKTYISTGRKLRSTSQHAKQLLKKDNKREKVIVQPKYSKKSLPPDICDSSVDNMFSRSSTLDIIIPPPNNFAGANNPFHNSNLVVNNISGHLRTINGNNCLTNNRRKVKQRKNGKQQTNGTLNIKSYNNNNIQNSTAKYYQTNGSMQLIRPKKRHLSANDILFGQSREAKQRRNRLETRNFEGTTMDSMTIVELPQPSSSSSSLLSTCNSINNKSIKQGTSSELSIKKLDKYRRASSYNSEVSINGYNGGRTLRQRQEKNYSDKRRSLIVPTVVNSCSTLQQISNVDNENSSSTSSLLTMYTDKSDSSKVIHRRNSCNITSVTNETITPLFHHHIYYGAAKRIVQGENFLVKSKRLSTNGKIQYLIEWDGTP